MGNPRNRRNSGVCGEAGVVVVVVVVGGIAWCVGIADDVVVDFVVDVVVVVANVMEDVDANCERNDSDVSSFHRLRPLVFPSDDRILKKRRKSLNTLEAFGELLPRLDRRFSTAECRVG